MRNPLALSEAVDFLDLGAQASKKLEHWRARLCGKRRKSTASFRERIKVRVIVSRARRAHVACVIPRAAFEALSENRFQALTVWPSPPRAARSAASPGRSGRGFETAESELRKSSHKRGRPPMKYSVNVDLETPNSPDGSTVCRVHPEAGKHYDITVHVAGCPARGRTHRPPKRYSKDFATIEQARQFANDRAAQASPTFPVKVRSCQRCRPEAQA